MSSILGGFLYYFWFRFPYLVQGTLYIISGIIALYLVEPKVDSKKIFLERRVGGGTFPDFQNCLQIIIYPK